MRGAVFDQDDEGSYEEMKGLPQDSEIFMKSKPAAHPTAAELQGIVIKINGIYFRPSF